ncbi:MAG: hypothetical protein J1E80_00875 [Desulfovibrionaceae bacterium]|nr:hypothetical protein [Desulfovibrionaceae bacterium]
MKNLYWLVLSAVMILGTGCSGNIQTTITPPGDYAINNSRTFDAPYDKVWDAAISSVGESFFVLENITRDSGIISITFLSKLPNNYIDCGIITDSGQLYGGKKHYLSFPGAETPVKRILIFNAQNSSTVRYVYLTGKINLIFKEKSKNSTEVKVNTLYIVDITHEKSYIALGGPLSGTMQSITTEHKTTFTANEIGIFSDGVQCRSRFTLEQQLLDGIQKMLNIM